MVPSETGGITEKKAGRGKLEMLFPYSEPLDKVPVSVEVVFS
jgi:hypothetical protein